MRRFASFAVTASDSTHDQLDGCRQALREAGLTFASVNEMHTQSHHCREEGSSQADSCMLNISLQTNTGMHELQPATAGMLPPSDSDEEGDESEEEESEEEAPKPKLPKPAVESAKP